MAASRDIFVSYEHSDVSIARKLAESLEQEGWSVWWDHDIPPGETWAEVIEKNLTSSRCVIVLWSNTSIKSKWVNKEARLAEKLEMLIPARIHDVAPPWEFEHLQAANLIGWSGARTEGLALLLEILHVRLLSAKAASSATAPDAPPPAPSTTNAAPKAAESTGKTEKTSRGKQASLPSKPPASPRPLFTTPGTAHPGSSARSVEQILEELRKTRAERPLLTSADKVSPSFRGSTHGRLVRFSLAIGMIGVIAALPSQWAIRFLPAIHISGVVRGANFLPQSWPSVPAILAVIVVLIIVAASWHFADDEMPMDFGEYVLVSSKSAATAAILALLLDSLFANPISPSWLHYFPLIAVATASVTVLIYAVGDEV